ncbi:MAG: rhodanese-like domain-containing protein [Victivallaceae bacterium]
MINTFFSQGTLNSSIAMATAAIIGFFFGLFLEKAGFGDSKRLSGIFYFRDMTVLKVMFSAVITTAIGFSLLVGFEVIPLSNVYIINTFYFAQIAGGLLLGIGFVVGGWCPGTAAVGVSSGSIDALLFLGGAVGGSILYNEIYPFIGSVKEIGSCGPRFAYNDLGMSRALFVNIFTVIAVGCFWGVEFIEKKRFNKGQYFNSPFLKAYSFLLIAGAATLFIFDAPSATTSSAVKRLEQAVQETDHIDAIELADRLISGDKSLLLIDVRSAVEFKKFHIKGALNIPLEKLPEAKNMFKAYKNVVLYSDGAAHAVQGQMLLEREGVANILVLNGGLNAFIEVCLKPVSLRTAPVDKSNAEKIYRYRSFFSSPEN